MSPKDVFWTKKVVIGDGERGLVYRNRQLEGVLAPGVHRWFDPMCRVDVVVHNIAKPEYAGNDSEVLIQALGVRLGDCFTLANLGTDEVGRPAASSAVATSCPSGCSLARLSTLK